jgi:ketol-acid reductoisomerase
MSRGMNSDNVKFGVERAPHRSLFKAAGLTGNRIITDQTKAEMKKILAEVQDGSFAKQWIKENENGRPNFNRMREADQNHLVEKVGSELREKMLWRKESK